MTVVRFASGAPRGRAVGCSRVVVRGDAAWVSGTTVTVDRAVAQPGDAGQRRQTLQTVEAEAVRGEAA